MDSKPSCGARRAFVAGFFTPWQYRSKYEYILYPYRITCAHYSKYIMWVTHIFQHYNQPWLSKLLVWKPDGRAEAVLKRVVLDQSEPV